MDIFYNKKVLLILLVLNLIGVIAAFLTYINDITNYISINQIYIIPFFAVSFWLYLFAFIFILYIYFNKEIPDFLGGLCFVYTFVYGFGALVFYLLFVAFVREAVVYNIWNIFAHGFVGLQSILFFKKFKKPSHVSLAILILIFLTKNIVDLFYGGFLYFVQFDFSLSFRMFLTLLIICLQVAAFYLLFKRLK